MAKSSSLLPPLYLLLAAALVLSSTATATATATGELGLNWVLARAPCQGSIAQCMENDDGEFAMDSEINRRILATTNYISYVALQRNSVPCSQRGASYYNCQSGGQANPYTRGCSAITRCRS